MLTKNKAFTPAVISCKGSAQIGFTGLLNQKRFGPAHKNFGQVQNCFGPIKVQARQSNSLKKTLPLG